MDGYHKTREKNEINKKKIKLMLLMLGCDYKCSIVVESLSGEEAKTERRKKNEEKKKENVHFSLRHSERFSFFFIFLLHEE